MALPHTPFILPAALGEKGLGAGAPTMGIQGPLLLGSTQYAQTLLYRYEVA